LNWYFGPVTVLNKFKDSISCHVNIRTKWHLRKSEASKSSCVCVYTLFLLISWCIAESVMCREQPVTLQVCWNTIRFQSLWIWVLKYFSLPQLTHFKRICWKQCCRLKTHFLPLQNHALETVLSSVIEEPWMHLHVCIHFYWGGGGGIVCITLYVVRTPGSKAKLT
jgi:hypothetical protein